MTRDAVVDILSYPGYKLLGTLQSAKGHVSPIAANETNGDILIDEGCEIYEYAHGGKEPIAKVDACQGYGGAADYAFDPTSQNIAVSFQNPSGGGAVGIYANPSSSPTLYAVPNMQYPGFLGYDDQGNLFVEGRESSNGPYVFAELPKGSNGFNDVTLNQKLDNMGTVQWDGSYITVAAGAAIYQIQLSGSTGTIVGQTTLGGAWAKHPWFWIQDGTVIGDHVSKTHKHNGRWLGLWNYPQGGQAFKIITGLSKDKQDTMVSEAVSIGS